MAESDKSHDQDDQLVAQRIDQLQHREAFPAADAETIQMRETHISWIFLAGDFAYKIKKPVSLDFLDYSTAEKRRHFCEQELRLDRRYAADLYVGVVPIVCQDGRLVVEGDGDPIDFAVKMRRFPDDALLSQRLEAGRVTNDEVFGLAKRIAEFHRSADRLDDHPSLRHLGSVETICSNAIDNLDALVGLDDTASAQTVRVLREWTQDYFATHRQDFQRRATGGFVRECHGDLHLANVVRYRDRWIPFDGIEFNESFRWIDVISDAAFAAMDFAARGRVDLSRSFINAYLEDTGDHACLGVLRWYLVYRATTRAKVAAMRAGQDDVKQTERAQAMRECRRYVELAYRFSLPPEPRLWITHGVSGSGKTTASEWIVQHYGAIRLRSDLERKRHFGLEPEARPSEARKSMIYGQAGTRATYTRLRRLGKSVLRAGFPVVIDATFLKREYRDQFRRLAEHEAAAFSILHCDADLQTLRQRVAERLARNDDASDADLSVLESQLRGEEPLDDAERTLTVTVDELAVASGH